MGKTHTQGLEIGDVGLDIWASPSLNHKVRLTALNTSARLHTQEGGHITQIRVANGSNALIVACFCRFISLKSTAIATLPMIGSMANPISIA